MKVPDYLFKHRNLLLTMLICINIQCVSPDHLDTINYRDEMRNFVIAISEYAKNEHPEFIVIPQNGQDLFLINPNDKKQLALEYLQAIDGSGREELFFGYEQDNVATPSFEQNRMLDLCLIAEENSIEVLTTDYCYDTENMNASYSQNEQFGFISFAASKRELSNIPSSPPYNSNNFNIQNLSEAKNFLYLINDEEYESKDALLNDLANTNYDIIIMDLFFNYELFSSSDIEALKTKKNGGQRLIICYLSIGEAEDYRYYWNSDWKKNPPLWLEKENAQWKGNYKVEYWNKAWQQIILGDDDAYLDKILSSNFDGVYLDLIDAFEYFEE